MGLPIIIEAYSPNWVDEFLQVANCLRTSLGSEAIRIDHIGSTSIAGLPAKPIIDIQVSVRSFEPMGVLEQALADAGFLWRTGNPELTKRYFRERPGSRRTHIHVRRHGSLHEQLALLFRDYMRAHANEHQAYADLKRILAERFRDDRQGYTDAKDDHFWSVIRRADHWAAGVGWEPGKSDA